MKGSNPVSSFLKSRRLSIDILTAFVGLLVVTVLIIVVYARRRNVKAIMELADNYISQVTETVVKETIHFLMPASVIIETSAHMAEKGALSLTDSDQLESFALEVLKVHPQLAMFNIGDEEGNFLMPKKLPDGTTATKIIDRTVEPPTVTWKYRDENGEITKVETSTDVQYDPRVRPWYRGAKELRDTYWTDIYILFTDRKPGITAAVPVIDPAGNFFGVFSIDIELAEMSRFLQALKIGRTGVAFIINNRNEVVAYPDETRIVKKENGDLRPVRVDELGEKWIAEAVREHERTGSDKFAFTADGKRYLALFRDVSGLLGRDWKIATVVPEDDFIGDIKETHRSILAIIGIMLLVAVLVAVLLSRSISRPIVLLAEETEKIKDFHLDDRIDISSPIKEIQLMSAALSSMKTGLQAFRRYVPAALVRQLIRTGEEARIGGQKRVLTVFFSDIAGFTRISEGTSPEALMHHLSEYLDELTRIVMDQKGTVDKYIGDAIMAFWGAPIPDAEHAFHACRAALLCQEKVHELNAKWEREGKSTFPTRIGIHTGETLVGNVGSRERMNYSALGDTVNLASRLEEINKTYGTQVIVSQATYEKVSDKFIFRPLDVVAVRGKKQEIMIYELVGERGAGQPLSGGASR